MTIIQAMYMYGFRTCAVHFNMAFALWSDLMHVWMKYSESKFCSCTFLHSITSTAATNFLYFMFYFLMEHKKKHTHMHTNIHTRDLPPHYQHGEWVSEYIKI